MRFIRQGRSFSGREKHCAFLNTGETRFANISASSGFDFDDDGRAIGCVDWDFDGDMDLWITNRNGPQLRFLRNSLPDGHDFLAIRLQGTTCNRDAIGARVELITETENAPQLVRTLRAGDGYLAQSSKWLHFGLGRQNNIDRLIVHWPGGEREEFREIKANQHYVIQQGDGQANAWNTPHETFKLVQPIGNDQQPKPNIEVLSFSNIPVPRLPYRAFDDTPTEVFRPSASGGPVLLNLWGSWCQPCIVELNEFAERQDEIRAAGLDVVALSVDGLQADEPTDESEVIDLLQRTGFPFRSGRADARLVEKLQIVNNYLFDLHIPLPIPTSVLIDGNGQLVALYKGSVSVDRVLRDVSQIELDVPSRREKSSPFGGRWHEPLNDIAPIPILDSLTEAGFLLEADDYVRRLKSADKGYLLQAIVRLGMAFYQSGNGPKAKEHFAVAVKIDPTFVGVEIALGRQREKEGRTESAIKLYREALRRDPQNIVAKNNLAWLLSTHQDDSIRNASEAVSLAEQVVKTTKLSNPSFLDTLAAAYAESEDFEKAQKAARRAQSLCLTRGQLEMARTIQQRLELYQNRQPFRQPSAKN